MNATMEVGATEDESYEFYIVLINAIVSVLVLIINAHQSYKNKHFASKCCGKDCMEFSKAKEDLM